VQQRTAHRRKCWRRSRRTCESCGCSSPGRWEP
jgi:hypothetical protein